jgi:4-diphosphocytidyl-2-C-methyl-D-erythritol kinase
MQDSELATQVAALRVIWGEVLGLDGNEIGDMDNFFDIGGDSMLALEAAAQARLAGMSMPLSGVLRRPVLAELAEATLDPLRF